MSTAAARVPATRLPVAVLGATGQVGQRFLGLLAEHPWFEVRAVTASPASVGRRYADTVRWTQTAPMPEPVRDLVVAATEPESAAGCAIAFSALDSGVATDAERRFAAAGLAVVSNASSHRMDPDVPLIVPEVNPGHLDLARRQRHGGGGHGGGMILTNPNCSTIGLVLALAPLERAFGVERVHVVTMQAVSGAGFPGVPSLLAIDNVVPFIRNEEDKLESEPRKILGRLGGEAIEPHPVTISAACNRVPVVDGHTLCVSVGFEREATPAAVREAWEGFRGVPQDLGLPSAPARPIVVLDGDDEPQPRLHRDLGGGMAVSVGRLRPCPLLDLRFVALSHNTVRGAAGGAILVAELAVARGLIEATG